MVSAVAEATASGRQVPAPRCFSSPRTGSPSKIGPGTTPSVASAWKGISGCSGGNVESGERDRSVGASPASGSTGAPAGLESAVPRESTPELISATVSSAWFKHYIQIHNFVDGAADPFRPPAEVP